MQNIINHIAFIIDMSSSMYNISDNTIKVFDKQIASLANLSKQLEQETRVTVYTFNGSKVNCIIFDKDVLRLPSIAKDYKPHGNTNLIDATIVGIEDLDKTFTKYGDHSFLLYTLTDGEENASKNSADNLKNLISSLDDRWTVAALVPNQSGKFAAKKFGFPSNNIQIWNVSNEGIEQVNDDMYKATNTYMVNRSKGIRSTSSLFQLDTDNLTTNVVQSKLEKLKPSEYAIYPVGKDIAIKDCIEGWTKTDYVIGSAYYMLTKPEKIQASKSIVVQDKKNGSVYSGLHARNVLGLPNTEVKVSPLNFSGYNIFVQSTSVNRKLLAGTNVLLMR